MTSFRTLLFQALQVLLIFACPLVVSGETLIETSTATPLTLEDCLTKALKDNFQVRSAIEQVAAQEGQVMSSRGQLLPRIDGTAQLQQVDQRRIPAFQNNRFGVRRRWDATIQVEQTLFAGGALFEAYRRESALLEAAQLAKEATLDLVAASVQQRFYETLLSKARIDVQEQLVQLREELLASEKRKLEVGSVSQFSVLQSEVALANSRPLLIQARNEYRISVEELRRLLGIEATTSPDSFSVKGNLAQVSPVSYELSQALVTAQEVRPDLQQLALLERAEALGIDIASAGYFPTITAYGLYGIATSPFSSRYDDRIEGWETGLRANWNFFDGFATTGRKDTAEAALRAAKVNLQDRKSSVEVAVRTAFSRWQEATELLAASRQVVKQAEEALRLARRRKDVGAGIQLEVLDAQVQLTEARTNEIQALRDYSVARVGIEQAMGTVRKGKNA
jgi:outer membrane protein